LVVTHLDGLSSGRARAVHRPKPDPPTHSFFSLASKPRLGWVVGCLYCGTAASSPRKEKKKRKDHASNEGTAGIQLRKRRGALP